MNTFEVSISKDANGSWAENLLKKKSQIKVKGTRENSIIREKARVEYEKENASLEAKEVT